MTSYAANGTSQTVLHYILFDSHSAHIGRVFALDFRSVDVDIQNNYKYLLLVVSFIPKTQEFICVSHCRFAIRNR